MVRAAHPRGSGSKHSGAECYYCQLQICQSGNIFDFIVFGAVPVCGAPAGYSEARSRARWMGGGGLTANRGHKSVKLTVASPPTHHYWCNRRACAGVSPLPALSQLPNPPTHATHRHSAGSSPISHMPQHRTSSSRVRALAPRERHWPCSRRRGRHRAGSTCALYRQRAASRLDAARRVELR